MGFSYKPNYFIEVEPNISDNPNLREPQIQGYFHTYKHFIIDKKLTHAVIILPTGVGKTGLMALLPYNICQGRVLIITPQIVIKDTVVDALNPEFPDNFWLKRKVIDRPNELPAIVEFEGSKTPLEVLRAANIVIINIQKLQSRLDSSPLNFLPADFFDMVIIDEAHHSVARTWVEAIHHFAAAKIIKVTGTPIRTDKKEIAGDLVYKYKLSQAMANGFVKSLENLTYIPDQLLLTIDNDKTKTYTVDQIYQMGLKDEDWVSRSVAYSTECSERVIDESIRLLEIKRTGSAVPHKIIATACSINHAEEIRDIYEKKDYRTAIIHSKLTEEQIEQAKSDIKNHRVKVVVNVSMLGEGYDHEFLSIAAIFRPFRNPLPYMQFIGRILRVIPDELTTKIDDNIGQIVSHKHLGLEELWESYKVEIQESEIIKHLKDADIIYDSPNSHDKNNDPQRPDIGHASERGPGKLIGDIYLTTAIIKKKQEEDRIREEKIKGIQEILRINREEAVNVINLTEQKDSGIKRPDKYFSSKKKDIDATIREVIVPKLIMDYGINQHSDNLKDCPLFQSPTFAWIKNKAKDNGGLLATYFNYYLQREIGMKRSAWTIDDYDIANAKLPEIAEYVEKVLEDFFGL